VFEKSSLQTGLFSDFDQCTLGQALLLSLPFKETTIY
jgi:hypothetical protein